ncbi:MULTISPECIES: ABC transporter permease [Haloferax]|uniref:ABC transporter permease n=3 Tax=Haloferax TaxID=2251 RepID=A0ACD5I652_9EURY|nr:MULTISPECIES: ABC transporter permease [Haloferax]ELZ78929.1 putative peptide ABC transporter permease y4tP [Haloferax lucentense DSM 14919]MBC9988392.1 ABC transporter permease [Haloferax sp. AS1]QIB77784.1 ABC transporter permease [Haloferax alexandrinus]RDZ30913.1 ABC transporter permease [Haloferax sp. Atlit-48N]RDZ34090.1 ABC transporter permease [Haloferax sp. Atlit-24N]
MTAHFRAVGRGVVEYGATLLAALTVNFALPHLAPGDPLRYVVGQAVADLSAAQRRELLATYGLDQPLHIQYVDYLLGIVRGDLGSSVMFGRPVAAVILEHLPSTLVLVGLTLVVSTLVGTLLGAWSAWNEGSETDAALLTALVAANSTPAFWVGMLFVSVFAFRLGWFPSYGIASVAGTTGVFDTLVDRAMHLALPLATLTLARTGGIYLVARGSVLTTTDADFVRFERAKGLSERAILFRHALPNALLPIYTRFTLQLGTLVGGAVVVETVFSYPGLGMLVYDAALARDYPLLQGAFLVLTVTVIAANVLADLTYPLVDPRTGAADGGAGE